MRVYKFECSDTHFFIGAPSFTVREMTIAETDSIKIRGDDGSVKSLTKWLSDMPDGTSCMLGHSDAEWLNAVEQARTTQPSTAHYSATTARMLRLAQPVALDGAQYLTVLNPEHAELIRGSGLVMQLERRWVLTTAGLAARQQLLDEADDLATRLASGVRMLEERLAEEPAERQAATATDAGMLHTSMTLMREAAIALTGEGES